MVGGGLVEKGKSDEAHHSNSFNKYRRPKLSRPNYLHIKNIALVAPT